MKRKHIGVISEVLQSEGWAAMRTEILEKQKGALLQLASIIRPPEVTDDALRGLISGLNWVLDYELRVTQAVKEFEADREDATAEARGVGSPMEKEVEPVE